MCLHVASLGNILKELSLFGEGLATVLQSCCVISEKDTFNLWGPQHVPCANLNGLQITLCTLNPHHSSTACTIFAKCIFAEFIVWIFAV